MQIRRLSNPPPVKWGEEGTENGKHFTQAAIQSLYGMTVVYGSCQSILIEDGEKNISWKSLSPPRSIAIIIMYYYVYLPNGNGRDECHQRQSIVIIIMRFHSVCDPIMVHKIGEICYYATKISKLTSVCDCRSPFRSVALFLHSPIRSDRFGSSRIVDSSSLVLLLFVISFAVSYFCVEMCYF